MNSTNQHLFIITCVMASIFLLAGLLNLKSTKKMFDESFTNSPNQVSYDYQRLMQQKWKSDISLSSQYFYLVQKITLELPHCAKIHYKLYQSSSLILIKCLEPDSSNSESFYLMKLTSSQINGPFEDVDELYKLINTKEIH